MTYRPRTHKEYLESLSPERRQKVLARAKELIAKICAGESSCSTPDDTTNGTVTELDIVPHSK